MENTLENAYKFMVQDDGKSKSLPELLFAYAAHLANYAAPIRAEVERLKCELSNNQKADISIADLRKVFAHRASRITEELNQGANQLMTLSDFRIAVADMGWRIGFDQIGELQSQLSAAHQRIAELQAELKHAIGQIKGPYHSR